MAITQKDQNMRKIHITIATGLLLAGFMPAFAYKMGMSMSEPMSAIAATGHYRFELAGPVQSQRSGNSIVEVRLVHDGKLVTGAIVIQSRADMGPIGMAVMTAPIKSLGEHPRGIYRFEVDNGSVWKKPANWALHFGVKVQGVAQTVTGSVTVKLSP